MTKVTGKLRILIADDHELVRRGIRALLRVQRGWRVVSEAADGSEAVIKTTKLKPDLAILDISMPNLDGLEAIRQIRGTSPSTQVLVLTMHDSDQVVRRALEAGARGYVLKSDLGMSLVKAVKDVSKGKRFLTSKVSEIVLDRFVRAGNGLGQTESSSGQPTPREVEIIRLLAAGKGNKETASALGITLRTVETHRAKIMLKLGLHSVVDLVHYAIEAQIVAVHGHR